ncbi:hypothetical protein EUGRSUZ_I02391 [Eucalyptus grandis]|uniref:Uncharacterized protein n=2 Tax=Eucalyptus grandis TaxID=71139 RepID=A0ACC3JIE8_EUCGR|nr:hypothetical protein EUGRSUZ_I02391 [Eucalyptus grandis]
MHKKNFKVHVLRRDTTLRSQLAKSSCLNILNLACSRRTRPYTLSWLSLVALTCRILDAIKSIILGLGLSLFPRIIIMYT